jgi:hypothetical protein
MLNDQELEQLRAMLRADEDNLVIRFIAEKCGGLNAAAVQGDAHATTVYNAKQAVLQELLSLVYAPEELFKAYANANINHSINHKGLNNAR